MSTVKEIKHNLDGTTELFDCYLLYRGADYVVLCYVSERSHVVAGVDLPIGSLTIGHYWRSKEYAVWEMYGPDGELRGYYVHICRNVEFGEDRVEWHDMAVDVWLGADARSEILDEDELERSVQSGKIAPAAADAVRRSAEQFTKNAPAILQQLESFGAVELLAALR